MLLKSVVKWLQVNHKLIGGMVVYIGDMYIDCSVASVLNMVEDTIRNS